MLTLIQNLATWRAWAAVTVPLIVVTLLFQRANTRIREVTSAPLLDGRLHGYTVDEARQAVRDYGAEGRRLYRQRTLRLDLVYPVLYAVSFVLMMAIALRRLSAPEWIGLLLLLPVAAAAFDYLENASVLALLAHGPEWPAFDAVADRAAMGTRGKWLLVGLSALAVAGLWIGVAVRALGARR